MESGFLNFMLALVIIIAAAKAGGYLSIRVKQPAVLGELLVGIILGPTLINLFHIGPFADDELLTEAIHYLAELGVLLLMMLAGLELNLSELLKAGRVSVSAGTIGVILPLVMGLITGLIFGQGLLESAFIGLALSATSVSISAQTLMELGQLRSRVGLSLLGAAVVDDILVILLLSIGAILAGGEGNILLTIGQMGLYLVAAAVLGLKLIPWLAIRVERLPISQGLVAFALVVCLLYAWLAEVVGGMAAITGAFMIGLFLGRTPFKKRFDTGISSIAYGFFVPIFFINIGLNADLTAIGGSSFGFALVLTIVAIVSKLAGCGLGGMWGGLTRRESLQLGVGMISRGEVGLIVASFALAQNAFGETNFAITVFMVIVATLVTPPLLRLAFAPSIQKTPPKPPQAKSPAPQPTKPVETPISEVVERKSE
ncbi:MAG: cation:proton antiporter [Chloroflexi bacterium]|nr:cation:proton antiporter [Chloroflexota bacterium]MBP8057431.1 cation:proton antiporter [Chloroflexota bacterium]